MTNEFGLGLEQSAQAVSGRGAVVSFLSRRLGLSPQVSGIKVPIDARYCHAFMGCDGTEEVGRELWEDLMQSTKTSQSHISVCSARLNFMAAWLRDSVAMAWDVVREEGLDAQINDARRANGGRQLFDAQEWIDDPVAELLVLEDLLSEVKAVKELLMGQDLALPPACSMRAPAHFEPATMMALSAV